jgi:hypothetical protein
MSPVERSSQTGRLLCQILSRHQTLSIRDTTVFFLFLACFRALIHVSSYQNTALINAVKSSTTRSLITAVMIPCLARIDSTCGKGKA